MPGVIFKRGEQVTLRTVEREDLQVIQRARNEPEFQEGFLIETPKNRKMVEKYFEENIEDDDSSIFLLICVDEDPVGGVNLLDIREDHGMLHYWLLPEERGNGYMTEGAALLIEHAFKSMGLHRVFAWTFDDNKNSQMVLQRLGFIHEGTYREHIFAKGKYHNTEHYGLLTSEWRGADSILNDV